MAVREIVKYPDEVLRRRAERIDVVDDAVRQLARDMVETMYAAIGIGLAAPQVGVSRRLIVVDVSQREEGRSLVALCNPEIVLAEGAVEFEEGCLSLPGFTTMVNRAEKVSVRGLDMQGRPALIEADGLLAIALQHEMDHLEGTLLLDRASPIKREFYKKRVRKGLAKTGQIGQPGQPA